MLCPKSCGVPDLLKMPQECQLSVRHGQPVGAGEGGVLRATLQGSGSAEQLCDVGQVTQPRWASVSPSTSGGWEDNLSEARGPHTHTVKGLTPR